MRLHEASGSLSEVVHLDGDAVLVGEDRVPLTSDAVAGTVSYAFGVNAVRLFGAITVPGGETSLEVVVFADGVEVARAPVDPADDSTPERSFELEVGLDVLRPADFPVRVVGLAADGSASVLGPQESSLFPKLPLVDVAPYWSSEYYDLVGLAFTRADDQLQLAYLTRWGLQRFEPGTPNFGASICVLGYRIVELPAELGRFAPEVFDAVARWNEVVPPSPSGYIARWHLSANCVAGYVALGARRLEAAEMYFDRVVASFGEVIRTPISAHNVAISTFLAGWLRYKRGDTRGALEHFRRTLMIIRVGMQVQPIETNFWVWNECVRMSLLGQQVLVLLAHLDPDLKDNAILPDEHPPFDMGPVLKRVPKLLETLPAQFLEI